MMLARTALVAAFLTLPLTAADSGRPPATPIVPAAPTDLTSLRARAEGGDTNAQYQLGLAYAQGLQTPKDPVEAFAWLTLAAEGGAGGRALQTLLETLPQAQVANGRRRLEALRTAHPVLRSVAATPLVPAPSASPIIAAPARQPAPSSPLIPAPAAPTVTPGEFKALQDQLASALQDKRQLSSELGAAWKEIEQLKAQPAPRPEPPGTAAAQAQLQQAQAALSAQAKELAAARAELARLQAELTTSRDALAARSAGAVAAEEAAAALHRERTAHAATQATVSQLKTQLNEAAASRAQLERDLMGRLSAADRAQTAAAEETRRLTASQSDLSARSAATERELTQARAELSRVREELGAANGRTKAETDRQVRQTAALEASLAAVRQELAQTKSALAAATTTAETAASRAASASRAENEVSTLRTRITALERDVQAAQDEARRSVLAKSSADRSLAAANQRITESGEELAALRRQTAAIPELEQRVRQLEAEKLAAATAGTGAGREEAARADAARTAAEDKLATALRAYSLLTQERDELRARVADLSAKLGSATESLAAAEARARTTAAAGSAASLASAELETLRNRAAAAERTAESARAEVERANQLLAGVRPATSAPTRPTVTPGQPARTHTIAPGETLSGISLRYYGTAARWPEILAANRDVLPDERSFVVGRTIRIP